MTSPLLSVVVPLYNEEKSLPELYNAIKQVVQENGIRHEILFVDDGSTDGSLSIIEGLQKNDPAVTVVSFRKNSGKSAALQAGFDRCKGDVVITMDADLQDDPGEIPNLLAKLDEGYDLVSGWKKVRHDPISKTIPSRLWNIAVAWLSGIRLHDFNCGLKAYRKEVVKDLHVYGEMHRFLPVLAKWSGFRMSKYTRKPLHLFGVLGLISMLLGLVICVYLAVGWFQGIWIGNRPILLLGVLLIVVGVQFFSIGLLGEMLTHSMERQASPSLRPLSEPRDREISQG
jgi:glycosyltransferase involved in cell wall biosynthesis